MKVVRHCSERLPGGLRRWRRLASKAGFTGTLRVRGFRDGDEHPTTKRVSVGRYRPGTIIVKVNAPCGRRFDLIRHDPMFTFAHELGHHHLRMRGRHWTTRKAFRTSTEQNTDSVEAACDRYARRLMRDVP